MIRVVGKVTNKKITNTNKRIRSGAICKRRDLLPGAPTPAKARLPRTELTTHIKISKVTFFLTKGIKCDSLDTLKVEKECGE